MTTHCGPWVIQNTHVESGAHQDDRDAREQQLKQLAHLHGRSSVPDEAVCILAGDFNLRAAEEKPLLDQGWRDAWEPPMSAAEDSWTWSGHGHHARFDRVFVHAAQTGASVHRESIARLTGLWPSMSDHVALHAVFFLRAGSVGSERKVVERYVSLFFNYSFVRSLFCVSTGVFVL